MATVKPTRDPDGRGGGAGRVSELLRRNLNRIQTEPPDAALTIARKSAEALAERLRHELGLQRERDRRSLLDDLVGRLPGSVADALRVVVLCGNYGSHNQEDVVEGDRRFGQIQEHHEMFRSAVLPCLRALLAWCEERERRADQDEDQQQRLHVESVLRIARSRRGDLWIKPELRRGSERLEFSVLDWVASPERVLYVTGEFGVGKTTYCLQLMDEVASASLDGRLQRVTPVVIELRSSAPDIGRVTQLLGRTDATVFDLIMALSPDVEAPRFIHNKYVVLIESIDELPERSAQVVLSAVCACLLHDAGPHKVIVSSRINCLRLHTRRLGQGAVAGRRYLYNPRENSIAISLFDIERINKYLSQRCPAPAVEAVRDAVRSEPRLRDLASRPLFLQMLTTDSPSVLEEFVGVARGAKEARAEHITITWLFEHAAANAWSGLPLKTARAISTAMGRVAYDLLTEKAKFVTDRQIQDVLQDLGVNPEDGLGLYAVVRSPFITSLGAGRLGFSHWSYCEFFGARHLADVENLKVAVRQHEGRLQELFCHRGIVDFLREMVGGAHAALLNELLSDDVDDAVAFSSHLMRSGVFYQCLPRLKEAFDRATVDQVKIYLVFAILTHLKAEDADWGKYVEFVGSHHVALRETLLEYVDGVEADVASFSLERLLAPEHRSKAALYLISLGDPAVWQTDRVRVRDTVCRFVDAFRPSEAERRLAHLVLDAVV